MTVKEPRRCLTCQLLTAKCMHPNTCRTCCKEHRTANCKVVNQAHFWFTSCKAAGHASWDQLCPAFANEVACVAHCYVIIT